MYNISFLLGRHLECFQFLPVTYKQFQMSHSYTRTCFSRVCISIEGLQDK